MIRAIVLDITDCYGSFKTLDKEIFNTYIFVEQTNKTKNKTKQSNPPRKTRK